MARADVLVDLALQGGGAHGAFTWGVLDRLLQEPWLHIDGISGTSAGAMNAAVLIHGFEQGGGRGPGPPWRPSGAASRRRPPSARSGGDRWTSCWAAGRWTTRRCSSRSTLPRDWSRPTTSTQEGSIH